MSVVGGVWIPGFFWMIGMVKVVEAELSVAIENDCSVLVGDFTALIPYKSLKNMEERVILLIRIPEFIQP